MEEKITNNLEVFYDVIDNSCSYIYEIRKKNYFELLLMTAKNIIAGEVSNEFTDEETAKLNEIYKPLYDLDFTVEDIRKAMQAQVLKGIKEMNLQNGLVTPDTIGIFMTYLISRLSPSASDLAICDPLIGSGNLLYTIANHLNIKNLELYGCDNNEWFIKISKVIADLMELNIALYLQDTLNLNLYNLDYIIFDAPNNLSNDFIYKAINYYLGLLKDDGYIIGMLNDDFFENDKDGSFKEELVKCASIIGIVELPDNFFVSNKHKFIIVIQKKVWKEKKCFMIKLPSFTDVNAFNKELVNLELWFNNNLKKERE